MRKVVLQEFVSIDGLVAGPNDSVDFIPASTQDVPGLFCKFVVVCGRCDVERWIDRVRVRQIS